MIVKGFMHSLSRQQYEFQSDQWLWVAHFWLDLPDEPPTHHHLLWSIVTSGSVARADIIELAKSGAEKHILKEAGRIVEWVDNKEEQAAILHRVLHGPGRHIRESEPSN